MRGPVALIVLLGACHSPSIGERACAHEGVSGFRARALLSTPLLPAPRRANIAANGSGDLWLEDVPPAGGPRPLLSVERGRVLRLHHPVAAIEAEHANEVLQESASLGLDELVGLMLGRTPLCEMLDSAQVERVAPGLEDATLRTPRGALRLRLDTSTALPTRLTLIDPGAPTLTVQVRRREPHLGEQLPTELAVLVDDRDLLQLSLSDVGPAELGDAAHHTSAEVVSTEHLGSALSTLLLAETPSDTH